MAGRKRSHRKKNKRYNANAGALLVTAVVIFFAVVMGFRMRSLSAVNHRYQVQIQALKAEEEAEQLRSKELEESRSYVQTRDYIEKIARERLGLIGQDETILKPNE